MNLPAPCSRSGDVAPTGPLRESEFQAILSLMTQTARGRTFLAEYHRRRRAADSAGLSTAVDQIESLAAGVEVERARLTRESNRAAEIVRRLVGVIESLRPLGDPRLRAVAAEAVARRPKGGLERRFAALVDLDERDLERSLKLFG